MIRITSLISGVAILALWFAISAIAAYTLFPFDQYQFHFGWTVFHEGFLEVSTGIFLSGVVLALLRKYKPGAESSQKDVIHRFDWHCQANGVPGGATVGTLLAFSRGIWAFSFVADMGLSCLHVALTGGVAERDRAV